jgi:hypothetical protein
MKKISSVISLSFLVLFLLVGCVGFSEDRKLEDIKRGYGFFHNSGTFTFCDVERNRCNSEEEWVSLVKPYMEE